MKLISIIILYALLPANFFSPGTAQPHENTVDFQIRKGFVTVSGSFTLTDYFINLNDSSGSDAIIKGRVRSASVRTGNATRDRHLQEKNWLDSEHYEFIEVHSIKVFTEPVNHSQTGIFLITIKGQSIEKTIPFRVLDGGNSNYLQGDFELSLSDFGIGSGFFSRLISDKVTISINLPI
ncbi:MAG: YceI family protein [Balneolales bacterium]|nr:YceI family protein [Balneolales bacterium]